ncbi:hypothetical protein NBRC116592_27960 [Colwellia sp. KU-HH00111]|uniref:hypothetical protein n=1 Tax=Colwellia sp. KU-HH00111 TaxID=3127652 RepID=UPI0031060827
MDIFQTNVNIPEKQPYEGNATQKQKQKLWELGFREQNIIDDLGKAQASNLIDQVIILQEKYQVLSFHKKKLKLWLPVLILSILLPIFAANEALFAMCLILLVGSGYSTLKHGLKFTKAKFT